MKEKMGALKYKNLFNTVGDCFWVQIHWRWQFRPSLRASLCSTDRQLGQWHQEATCWELGQRVTRGGIHQLTFAPLAIHHHGAADLLGSLRVHLASPSERSCPRFSSFLEGWVCKHAHNLTFWKWVKRWTLFFFLFLFWLTVKEISGLWEQTQIFGYKWLALWGNTDGQYLESRSVENLMRKVWARPMESVLVGLMILGKISARLEHFATHKWLFP